MIVVLVDPRRPSLVPVEAIELLTGEVQYTEEMPVAVPWSLPTARPAHTGDDAPVLLSSDPDHPAVHGPIGRRRARLISAPDAQPRRTTGRRRRDDGQTAHRRAVGKRADPRLVAPVPAGGDLRAVGRGAQRQRRRAARRTRRRVAAGALPRPHRRGRAAAPFAIDDVADTLMRKLGNRVPGVLAGESISLEEQLAQWEERKASEKPRNSVMDDVHTGQPALALAQKVIQRVDTCRAARRPDSRGDHRRSR